MVNHADIPKSSPSGHRGLLKRLGIDPHKKPQISLCSSKLFVPLQPDPDICLYRGNWNSERKYFPALLTSALHLPYEKQTVARAPTNIGAQDRDIQEGEDDVECLFRILRLESVQLDYPLPYSSLVIDRLSSLYSHNSDSPTSTHGTDEWERIIKGGLDYCLLEDLSNPEWSNCEKLYISAIGCAKAELASFLCEENQEPFDIGITEKKLLWELAREFVRNIGYFIEENLLGKKDMMVGPHDRNKETLQLYFDTLKNIQHNP